MTSYTVNLSAKAAEWLEGCRDSKLQRRIAAVIDALTGNPRPPGCVKLGCGACVSAITASSTKSVTRTLSCL